MEITLQYFDGCPNWKAVDGRLAEILADRTDATLTHQLVDTPDDARRLRFHGSPTVLIDGRDPFAEPDAPGGLACRVFRTPDGPAGGPTVEQLRAAIEDARAHSAD